MKRKLTSYLCILVLAVALIGGGCHTKHVRTTVIDPSVTQIQNPDGTLTQTTPAGDDSQVGPPADDRVTQLQNQVTRIEAQVAIGVQTLKTLQGLPGLPQNAKFNAALIKASNDLAKVQAATTPFFDVVRAMKTFDKASLKAAFASLPGVINNAVPSLKEMANLCIQLLNEYHITDWDPVTVANSIDLAATVLSSGVAIIGTYFN